MNQLGFFDEIKKEDYDIKQNAKDKTVDVLVKVKEKGKNSIGLSGGISGLAGNFVGLNYATNNFLGLGATLSLGLQWGTFQKMYSFGFTEPYLFDKPITAGFTVFKSDYNYNQIRQLAIYSGVNPKLLAQSQYGQFYGQNFTQNSDGFTMFASYPLRRSFARLGLTYSFSRSSLQAFSAASESYFQAINFSGLTGPNSPDGHYYQPDHADLSVQHDQQHVDAHQGQVSLCVALDLRAAPSAETSTPSGPPSRPNIFARFGTFAPTIPRPLDCGFLRPRSSAMAAAWFRRSRASTSVARKISADLTFAPSAPMAFYPTVVSVCNRDNNGNPITGTNQTRAIHGLLRLFHQLSRSILPFSLAAIRRWFSTSNIAFPSSVRRPAWRILSMRA